MGLVCLLVKPLVLRHLVLSVDHTARWLMNGAPGNCHRCSENAIDVAGVSTGAHEEHREIRKTYPILKRFVEFRGKLGRETMVDEELLCCDRGRKARMQK